MPKKESPLSDVFEIGTNNPSVGAAIGSVLGIAGLYFWLASPKAMGGFGLVSGMFLVLLSIAASCGAAVGAIKAAQRRRRFDEQREIDDLKKMSWRDFEHLVSELFR